MSGPDILIDLPEAGASVVLDPRDVVDPVDPEVGVDRDDVLRHALDLVLDVLPQREVAVDVLLGADALAVPGQVLGKLANA